MRRIAEEQHAGRVPLPDPVDDDLEDLPLGLLIELALEMRAQVGWNGAQEALSKLGKVLAKLAQVSRLAVRDVEAIARRGLQHDDQTLAEHLDVERLGQDLRCVGKVEPQPQGIRRGLELLRVETGGLAQVAVPSVADDEEISACAPFHALAPSPHRDDATILANGIQNGRAELGPIVRILAAQLMQEGEHPWLRDDCAAFDGTRDAHPARRSQEHAALDPRERKASLEQHAHDARPLELFHHGRLQQLATELAIEVRMALEHSDVDAVRRKLVRDHHSGGAAAYDDDPTRSHFRTASLRPGCRSRTFRPQAIGRRWP